MSEDEEPSLWQQLNIREPNQLSADKEPQITDTVRVAMRMLVDGELDRNSETCLFKIIDVCPSWRKLYVDVTLRKSRGEQQKPFSLD